MLSSEDNLFLIALWSSHVAEDYLHWCLCSQQHVRFMSILVYEIVIAKICLLPLD